jgi:hypothetical protein
LYTKLSARDSTLTAASECKEISRKGAKKAQQIVTASLALLFAPWRLCVRHAFFSICGKRLRQS